MVVGPRTNLQVPNPDVTYGGGSGYEWQWPSDRARDCDSCWYTCCCLEGIEVAPMAKARSRGFYSKTQVHYAVLVSGAIVHTDDPQEEGAECGMGWWEMGEDAGAPVKYDKWGDGKWNDSVANNSAASSAHADAMASQARSFSLAKSSGSDVPLAMGMGDFPFNEVPFFRGWGHQQFIVYVEASSGCSGCPDCCALILLDYSREPIGMQYRSGCGQGCGIPSGGGGWREGTIAAVYGGNPMLLYTRVYDKPDVKKMFDNATRIGAVHNVDWSAFTWRDYME